MQVVSRARVLQMRGIANRRGNLLIGPFTATWRVAAIGTETADGEPRPGELSNYLASEASCIRFGSPSACHWIM